MLMSIFSRDLQISTGEGQTITGSVGLVVLDDLIETQQLQDLRFKSNLQT